MSTTDAIDRATPEQVIREVSPTCGEPVSILALPTVGIYAAALTAFVVSTLAYIGDRAPVWVPITVNAAVTFVMFTVVHDATHRSISSKRWANGLFGRLAWLFVAPLISFPSFAYIHIEHHRHTNDAANDPGTFASHGRVWQLPFRWALAGAFYARFLGPRLRSRPVAEVAETTAMFIAGLTGLIAAVLTGNLWTLAVVFLIPEHIGLIVLEWWFDWLPHHGLKDTQRSNRYRAARARVGMEWLFTPLMLAQNYHLVHHLHPSVPFYRYARTWRHNEEHYLDREVAIATVLGQQLTADEFREWKQLNRKLGRLVPLHLPARSTGVDQRPAEVELVTGDELAPASRRGFQTATVTFRLSGQQVTFDLAPGDSVLAGALQVRSDTPYGCMGGACGTCRAKLLTGTVDMDQNSALAPAEIAAGYVLTCQSHPTSPAVSIDYDA